MSEESGEASNVSWPGWAGLYLKGFMMGIADAIPGVSGGTVALVLGIYEELVDALASLDLSWIKRLWTSTLGRGASLVEVLISEARRLKIPFLVVLGAGIFTAISVAGAVLPPLIENHPMAVRGVFFGLILGSVHIPARQIDFRDSRDLLFVGFVFVLLLVAGLWLTGFDKGSVLKPRVWQPVESSGETLDQLTSRVPVAGETSEILAMSKNRHLADEPVPGENTGDLYLPTGEVVYVSRPPLWHVFLSGAVAVSAMILPGVSGAYILLVLGSYTFVLDLVNLLNRRLSNLAWPGREIVYIVLFGAGMALGLLVLSRLLRYLLDRYHNLALGGLVGLMLGCLRGLWPLSVASGSVSTGHLVLIVVFALAAGALVHLVDTLAWAFRTNRKEGGQ